MCWLGLWNKGTIKNVLKSTIQYMQNPKMNSISSAPKIGWLIEFFPKEIKSGFKKKNLALGT